MRVPPPGLLTPRLIGRETDVVLLRQAMRVTRLVTVVGPGGVGKTRLVAAVSLVNVWRVDLAAASDVPSAVLAAVGAREAGDALLRLEEFFADQRAVLVLDGCDDLLTEVADLVDRLLDACPRLRILATSREPLAIAGEHLFRLRPLPLPDGETADPADHASVRLFVDRAPDFRLDAANAGTVAEICRRLGGLPLAIELAAAWTRTMTVTRIAAGLGVRPVVEWSWSLLSPADREQAMRLAALPCGATHFGAALVGKGWATRHADRYRMPTKLRSFALARLEESGQAHAVLSEHSQYIVRLTEQADAQLRTAGQIAAMALLSAERENIVAALRFAVDTRDAELGLRLAGAMFWFWTLRGSHSERLKWTRVVLRLPSGGPRALRLVLHGTCLLEGGDIEAGTQAMLNGIGLGQSGPTVLMVAPALLGRMAVDKPLSGWERGMRLLAAADDDGETGAFARLTEARREFEALGDRFGLAASLRTLAEHHVRRGAFQPAEDNLTQATALLAELGFFGDLAETCAELATVLTRTGSFTRAQIVLRGAWSHAEASQEPYAMAYVRLARAELLLRQGKHSTALAELEDAEIGYARISVLCAGYRAMIALLDDDFHTARKVLEDVVDYADVPLSTLADVTRVYAALALSEGTPDHAAYLVGVADALVGFNHRSGYDSLLRPVDRARAQLGHAAYISAYQRGAALTPESAVAVIQYGMA